MEILAKLEHSLNEVGKCNTVRSWNLVGNVTKSWKLEVGTKLDIETLLEVGTT